MHINYLHKSTNSQAALKAVAVLWVPSEKIVSHQVPKPTAPKRKWPELIPWLLEDRLLQKADDIHFVISNETKDNNLEVLATHKQDIKEWLEQANKAQIKPSAFLPDYLALPWKENSISLAQRDDILIIRLGQYTGFAADIATASTMLSLLINKAALVPTISLAQDIQLDSLPKSLAQLVDSRFELDWHLAVALPKANLLVGEYRQKSNGTVFNKKWVAAALLFFGLGLCFWYFSFYNNTKQVQSIASNQQTEAPVQEDAANNIVDNSSNQLTSPSPRPAPQRRSNLSAQLLGLVINGNLSTATIRIDGQAERVVHLDEDLGKGLSIQSISKDKVIISDNGIPVELSLKKYDSLIQESTNSSRSQASDNSNGFALANMFAAVPVQVDNYGSGLKLDNLSEELTLLSDIQQGDIVVQVGSSTIQELLSDPMLWTNFSANTQLPITLIRDGQEVTLDVNAFSLSSRLLPNIASGILP